MKANYEWCYHHHEYEDRGPDPYRICGECGHVYRTPADLVNAYNYESKHMAEHWNELLMGDTVPDVRQLTVEQHMHIGFCQYCLHDW
jgi:hypothetical protein